MKKSILILVLILSIFFATPVHAASDEPTKSGYTEDHIYYEITTLALKEHMNPLADSEYITVTQQVTYSGIVTPGTSIDWTETLDGTTYIGTLYLSSYYHTPDHTTIAIYKGTLYKE